MFYLLTFPRVGDVDQAVLGLDNGWVAELRPGFVFEFERGLAGLLGVNVLELSDNIAQNAALVSIFCVTIRINSSLSMGHPLEFRGRRTEIRGQI